jgi:hypothetical protein
VEPDVDAKAIACDCTHGSSAAWLLRTSWRMERKRGFSVREVGLGGSWEVVPTERFWEGGDVGRKVKMCEEVAAGFGRTY